MSYKHNAKQAGELIRSTDWNAMGLELVRLEKTKFKVAGDTAAEGLTVQSAVKAKSLAVSSGATCKDTLTSSGGLTVQTLTVQETTTITGNVTANNGVNASSLVARGALTAASVAVSGKFDISGRLTANKLTVSETAALNGNVDIGTATARADLNVKGTLQFQPFSTLPQAQRSLYPLAATSQVRLINGRIRGDGATDAGTGFTVTRLSAGRYRITFATAFTALPSVMAAPAAGNEDYPPTCSLWAVAKEHFEVDIHHFKVDPAKHVRRVAQIDAAFQFVAIGA